MPRIVESGHAINVANFETLISFCTGYGVKYNPANANIKLSALQELLTNAQADMTALNAIMPAYSQAVGIREAAFEPLSRLVTRIINAFAASGASEQSIDNAKTVGRKLQGRRAKSIAPPKPAAEGMPSEETPKTHSVSQMSFDNRIENFDRLIQILKAESTYKPNEIELQVATLETLLADLRAINTAVINATTPLSNARIVRNETLYTNPNNLIQAALDTKIYVKSVFGTSSAQYKQISGIKFTKP